MKIYNVKNDVNFNARGQKTFVEHVAKPIIEKSKEKVVKPSLKFTPARVAIKNKFNQFCKNILNFIRDMKDNISDCFWNNFGLEIACIILGILSAMGGFGASVWYLAAKAEDKNLENALTSYATKPESTDGSAISEEEKTYISESMQYFEDITADKTWQRPRYSKYIEYFSKPESDEGLKLTDKEKENIEYMIENKIRLYR